MELNQIHKLFLACSSVSTDTRNISQNAFFFALKGPNFNANAFAVQALESGASYAVIDEVVQPMSDSFILVDNVLKTLQDLARFHRDYLGLPVVALTGSNGKTTTKELINAALQQRFKTIATIGNLNNHIGVPLTLLSMTPKTEIGIVEMGANHQKEIQFLCTLCEPDFGYITNFGKAHLEGFGGLAGVIKGKSELYDFLEKNKKTAFINPQDSLQEEKTKNTTRHFFPAHLKFLKANPFVQISFD